MSYVLAGSRPIAIGLCCLGLLAGCSGEEVDETEGDDPSVLAAQGGDGGVCASPDAGGQTPGGGGHGSNESGLPCDIAKALQTSCGTCHGETPSFGAPMALASATDFQGTALGGGKMTDVVKARINETDPRRRMPPASSPQFTPEQLASLNAWLGKGAPASSESCGGSSHPEPKPTEPIDTKGLTCYKLTAHAGDLKTPYKVGAARDAYFNFTFKAPWQGTAYAVVFRPVIDNMAAIHHWLLFQEAGAPAATGAVPSIGAHPGAQLLSGWAPGGEPTDFRVGAPPGETVALELPGNKSYTVEFHYNSSDANAKDASGVEICVQKEKPTHLASMSWLGLDQLIVPAKKWVGTCRPKAPQQPIHILGVTPHMHKTGVHMKGTINRANGTKEILHDAPFDFNYQVSYRKDVWLMPGDSITTECTFSKPMAFGESTNAEMCYLFTMAYPRNALSDNGLWGQIAHGGGSCLGQ